MDSLPREENGTKIKNSWIRKKSLCKGKMFSFVFFPDRMVALKKKKKKTGKHKKGNKIIFS